MTARDASTDAPSLFTVESYSPYRASLVEFSQDGFMLEPYSSVDADSNKSLMINLGPQEKVDNDISSIQVSNGERISIMMPAYKDIEGDPVRISFSNVENFLLA